MTTSSEEIKNINENDIIENELSEHENNDLKNMRKRNPRQCFAPGCNKCSQGSTKFCIAHGGGRRCTFPGCYKAARDKQFCAGHGGGRRCSHDDCKKAAVGGSFYCTSHGGGKKCTVPGCEKSAQSPTQFCVRHGGGKTCKHEGCRKVARGRSEFCAGHGGGSNCRYPACLNVAVSNHIFCRDHRRQFKKSGLTVLKQGKNYYLSSLNSKIPLIPCEDLIHYVGGLTQSEFQIQQVLTNLGYTHHDSILQPQMNYNNSTNSTSTSTTTTTIPATLINAGHNNGLNININNNGNHHNHHHQHHHQQQQHHQPHHQQNNNIINNNNNIHVHSMDTIPTHTQSVLFPTMSSQAFFYPSLNGIPLPLFHQDSPIKSDDHEGNHSDSGTDTISNSGSDCSTTGGVSYSYLTSTSSPTSSVSSGISSSNGLYSSSASSSELNSASNILYEFSLPFQCYPIYQSKYNQTFSTPLHTNIMNTATIPIVLSSSLTSELLHATVSSEQTFIEINPTLPIPFNSNYQINSNKRTREEFELSSVMSSPPTTNPLSSNLSYYTANTSCI